MAGTMQQIAELTGVSRGTVDRVLHNRGRVKKEVAERVKEAAREVGYMTKSEKRACVHSRFLRCPEAYGRSGS